MVIILALAMTQAWATVLVIHGPYPNLVKCQSSRGEQDLSKLSDGVYAACTLDSSFVYCADDECEVVSRTPDDLNHVFGKTQAELSLNLPAIPVVNPMLYFNESARPPTSELFDDQRVASILFSAHGNFSPDYTECTISVVTSHLAYVGVRGKCKWGGGVSSSFSPHGFHLNPSGNIGGYNKIYIKKSLFDDSFAIEKLGHDIVQAFGVSDFRASYALVTESGLHTGLYLMQERIDETYVSAVHGPASLIKAVTFSLDDFDATDFDVEFENSALPHALESLNSLQKSFMHASDLGEISRFYDIEHHAKLMAAGAILNDRDSFFINNVHNYYYVQQATDGIWKALLWDFDLSLNHPLIDVNSFGNRPLETRTLKKHPLFLAMFSEHITKAKSIASIFIERGIVFNLMATRLDNYDRVITEHGQKWRKTIPDNIEEILKWISESGCSWEIFNWCYARDIDVKSPI